MRAVVVAIRDQAVKLRARGLRISEPKRSDVGRERWRGGCRGSGRGYGSAAPHVIVNRQPARQASHPSPRRPHPLLADTLFHEHPTTLHPFPSLISH